MVHRSLFLFTLSLIVVMGTLHNARRAPVEKLMLLKVGAPGEESLQLYDPVTDTQFPLTPPYQLIDYSNFEDNWIYFWGKEGITAPHNTLTLYRVNLQSKTRQKILDDAYSQTLTRFVRQSQKILYVRHSGELAQVDFDGTANHNIDLPPDTYVALDGNATFSLSRDTQALYFASPQDGNVDFLKLSLVDGAIENLTAQLPMAHQCDTFYWWYEPLYFVQCNETFYYWRGDDDTFYQLIPSTVSSNVGILGPSADGTLLYVYDHNSLQTFGVPLDDPTDPLPYTEVDTDALYPLLRGDGWQMVRKKVADHYELWHIRDDGTETKLFEHDQSPFVRALANDYYLLITTELVSGTIAMYAIAPDGLEIEHLYSTNEFFVSIGQSAQGDAFYFVEAIEYNPRVYRLKSINEKGQVKSFHIWAYTNRLLGWSDSFAREWEPNRWVFIGLLLMWLPFIGVMLRHKFMTN